VKILWKGIPFPLSWFLYSYVDQSGFGSTLTKGEGEKPLANNEPLMSSRESTEKAREL